MSKSVDIGLLLRNSIIFQERMNGRINFWSCGTLFIKNKLGFKNHEIVKSTMTMITFNGPMCGFLTIPQTSKPFQIVTEQSEMVRSWSNENHKFYKTVGFRYCSCKAFEYGNGKMCKHLIAKSVKPRLILGKIGSQIAMSRFGTVLKPENRLELYKSVQDYAGTYNYLGTFNFPVWVLDRADGSSVYLFKGRKYNRWMFTDMYSEIFTEQGMISTKQAYPPDSIIPPNDFWTDWRIWLPSKQIWVQSHDVIMTK